MIEHLNNAIHGHVIHALLIKTYILGVTAEALRANIG